MATLQQKVFSLFSKGRSDEEVRNLIRMEASSDSEVESLFVQYRDDYDFLIKEDRRIEKRGASMSLIAGIILVVASLLFTLIVYIFSNKLYLRFNILTVVVGVVMIVRAIIAKNDSSI